ncbi:MAG: hypothetical protein NVSMB52_19100 [Chloroflexota bacterium]
MLITGDEEGKIPEPVKPSQRRWRLEAHYEDDSVFRIQLGLCATQLRDMLTARESSQPAQENQQHGASPIRTQKDGVPLQIHEFAVQYVMHGLFIILSWKSNALVDT